MNDIIILEKLLNEIRDKARLPVLQKWNNSHYSELSDLIFENSGVMLSRNTLKNIVQKILSKTTDYSPQQGTKDALCKFLGYTDWSNYKQSILPETSVEPEVKTPNEALITFKKSKKIYVFLAIGVLVIAFIPLLIYLSKSAGTSTHKTPIPFTFELSDTAGLAPHTITINYNFEQHADDSIFVDFDTYSVAGRYELQQIQPGKGVLNFCYFHPGYYRGAVYVNKKPIKHFNVYIKSDGWKANVYDARVNNRAIPTFILPYKTFWPRFIEFDHNIKQPFIAKGEMKVSKEQAQSIENLPINYKTEFINFKDFGTDGDHFTFITNFEHKDYGEETYCYSVMCSLIGDKGTIFFQIMQPGCKVFAKYRFSEVFKSGIKSTVNGFEHDFSYPRTVVLKNRNKQIELSIDGEVFHTNTYTKDIGNIIGIQYDVKGAASIHLVELQDSVGKTTYVDRFE